MRIFGRESVESARAGGTKSPVSRALSISSSRIGEIVSAATAAAADIRSEADALRGSGGSTDSKISRERLVAELADSLVARAEELKRDAANLADVLERASKRLDAGAGAPTTDSSATTESPAPTEAKPAKPIVVSAGAHRLGSGELQDKVADRFEASEPAPATGRRVAFRRRSSASPRPVQPTTPSADGLRLLATQMAVAGSNREEIEERLLKDFGVEDANSLLGDIGTGRVEKRGIAGG
jgi:hypothetical protein